MRTRWEDLRHCFDRVVRHSDPSAFMRAASRHPALSSFADRGKLFAYLLERPRDLDERDGVLGALVMMVRDEPTRELATALLWLAVWPGLCGIYFRRIRRHTPPDEIVSAICFAFTSLVHDVDLARVHRVAATLVRSTERIAVETLRSRAREVPLEDDTIADSGIYIDVDGDLESVRRLLMPVVGRDADLLIGVAVFEETQTEAAERLGISAAAARKRYQRALQVARVSLAEAVGA